MSDSIPNESPVHPTNTFKYFAFISYSRKDAKAAAWLQRRLEWFRFPVQIAESARVPSRSRYIRPIYRDKTHLETDDVHYWSNIKQAIEQSRFLIVLCSPESARSAPVNEEVRYFLEQRASLPSILPVVLSGRVASTDEDNCLCPELGNLGDKIINRNFPSMATEGETSEIDAWERGFVGIISYMLSLKREALIDHIRREERKRTRTARTIAGGTAFLALAAVVGTVISVIKTREAERSEAKANQASRSEEMARKEATAKNIEASLKAHGRAQQSFFSHHDHKMGMAYLAEAIGYDPRNKSLQAEALVRLLYPESPNALPIADLLLHEDFVHTCAFSPDGLRIVTSSADFTARIWDSSSGKLIGEPLRHEDIVNTALFSPNGTRVLTASNDNTARIWDVATGSPVGEILRHERSVQCAAFSPDGNRVATASDDQTARIWDTASGNPVGNILRHTGSVQSVAFSPDGNYIVTASDDQTARIWDAFSGTPIGETLRHNGPVRSAAYSNDGKLIVTSSDDNTARIWDSTSGKPLAKPMLHERGITSAAFSPDDTLIVTAASDAARIWDISSGNLLCQPFGDSQVYTASFSPDGTRVLTSHWDDTARIWETSSGQSISAPLRHEGDVYGASFSPDGTRVVTAGEDRTARIWNVAYAKNSGESMRHEHGAKVAIFSPDGTRIVTAGWDGTARIWSATSTTALRAPLVHGDGMIRDVSFSPDGARIATAGNDGLVRIWDLVSGDPIGEPMRHGNSVNNASFSHDGKFIVTASNDYTARIWDSLTGRPVSEPLHHEQAVETAYFSMDGSRVITITDFDNPPLIWDVSSGKKLHDPHHYNELIAGGSPSRIATHILVIESDDTVRLQETGQWDCDLGVIQDLLHLASEATISSTGSMEELPIRHLLEIRSRLLSRTHLLDEASRTLVHWYFTSPAERTLSPFRKITANELVERDIDWCFDHLGLKQCKSILRDAIALTPAHPLITIGVGSTEKDPNRRSFLISYGANRLPDNPRLLIKAAGYLRKLEAPREALIAAERALAHSPDNPELLEIKKWATDSP